MTPSGPICRERILAAVPGFSTFNYCVAPSGLNTYLYNVKRVDQNFGSADRVWARYSRDGPTSGLVEYIPNAANTSSINGWQDRHSEISWSHIFAPAGANEFRVGYVEENNFNTPSDTGVPDLGLKGVPLTQFPNITVTGFVRNGKIGASSYSRTLDRHFIKFTRLPLPVFSLVLTHSPALLHPSPGQAVTGLADLELGLPATTNITTNNYEFSERFNYAALYF